ncbi:MAG: zinc ribbon domain-containing protein [Pseudomonadota bacterium]
MPIYEYQCARCGTVFEFIERFSEAGESRPCGACGNGETKRMLSRGVQAQGMIDNRSGSTCCGREERCDQPPCGDKGGCRR